MNITRFIKEEASPGHNGTILSSKVLPDGMSEPFDSAWGYLENNSQMESHSHPAEEVYLVVKGQGIVVVGNDKKEVSPGEVIEIPPDVEHTMICEDKGPFLWSAFWWDK